MYLSIVESGETGAVAALTIDPASLYSAFEQVTDGRKQKGKRYPLPFLLTLLMLGKLAGETTVIASVLLKARAVEQCGSEPSRLQAHKQEETLTQVAMDGKTVRGTLGHASEGQPSVHLLSLYECHSGIVLTRASGSEPRK